MQGTRPMIDRMGACRQTLDESAMPRVSQFLDVVGPAAGAIDVERQTSIFATDIQRCFSLDLAAARDVCHRVLEMPEPSTRALIHALEPLGVQPGWPWFGQQQPQELLRYLCDARTRGETSARAGISTMPVFAMASSGSTYSTLVMGNIMGVPMGVASIGHFMAYRPWVEHLARFPISVHDHMPPHPHNLRTLSEAGIKRVVVQVRDPRQFVVSRAGHARSHGHDLVISDEHVRRVSPHIANWVTGWRFDASAAGIAVHVVRYEDLVAQGAECFSGILDFFDASITARERLPSALENAERSRSAGGVNYRVGRPDEWTEVLTPKQQARIGTACARAFAGLYSF
jgi:hypothetical protein